MGKTAVLQTSFASGEITPYLYGRVDKEIYYNGAAALRNVYITPLGGVLRRPGQKYIDSTTTNQAARFVSFQFNVEQSYLLVFTPLEMKVYKDGVLQATVVTTMTADIISGMNWTQSADTLIVVHKDMQPVKITRTSHTAWTITNITFANIPTWDFGAITPSGTMAISATTGKAKTVTASVNTFTSDMVGYTIRFLDGVARITAYTSEKSVTVDVVDDFTATTATSAWELWEPVWSSTRGWPVSVTFAYQRLFFGGSKSRPQTIWGSKIAGFFDFETGSGLDAEAIEWTIDDDEVNAVVNIFAGRTLQIFTTAGEFFIPISSGTITPGNFKLEKATRHGSDPARPFSTDGSTVFVERGGNIVREYLYLDVEQSYVSENISFLAAHLINSPCCVAVHKSNELAGEYSYFVNSDGTMAVLNRRRSQSFLAWSLFITDGNYEQVAVVGSDVYVSVLRGTNRFIEKFDPAYYTDSGVILTSGTATTTWTGLSRLEGETVNVRSQDGYPLLQNTVASGDITTETEQTSIEVGYPFSPTIRVLAPEDANSRSLSGKKRRIVSLNLNLNNSRGFKISNGTSVYDAVLTTFGSLIFNQVSPLFSGWKKMYLRGISREPYVEITQEQPDELHVLSLIMEVTT